MKKYLVILFILSICAFSCESNRNESSSQEKIPEPLEEESSMEISSSRSGDLVQQLYNDLAKRDEQIKSIEKQLNNLRKYKNDSLEVFDKYSENNSSFYNVASTYSSQITDSSLKRQMDALIGQSLERYNNQMIAHKNVVKAIELNNRTIANLHLALMILRTIPIMEKYQKHHKPSVEPLQNYKSKQAEASKNLQTLIKK
jgi:hypothetical protein